MATITLRDLITAIITANGKQYPDEPAVTKITEFENYEGITVWGLVWEIESFVMQNRYQIPSQYVNNPRIIWQTGDPPQRRS